MQKSQGESTQPITADSEQTVAAIANLRTALETLIALSETNKKLLTENRALYERLAGLEARNQQLEPLVARTQQLEAFVAEKLSQSATFFNAVKNSNLLVPEGLEAVHKVCGQTFFEEKQAVWHGVHLKFISVDAAKVFRRLFEQSKHKPQIALLSYPGRYDTLYVEAYNDTSLDIEIHRNKAIKGQKLLEELVKFVDLSDTEVKVFEEGQLVQPTLSNTIIST